MASIAIAFFLALATCGQAQVNKRTSSSNIPPEARDLCAIQPQAYSTHPALKNLCSAKWQQTLKTLAGQQGYSGSKCCVDKQTHQMICAQEAQCKGGLSGTYQATRVVSNITYDCYKYCHSEGSLFLSCCDTCHLLQKHPPRDFKYTSDNIFCTGCKDKLPQVIANDAQCSMEDGKYFCSSSESCKLGDPRTQTSKVEYDCKVADCRNCQDDQLRALCCRTCSEKVCSGRSQRLVCLGCTTDDGFPGTDFRMPEVSEGAVEVEVCASKGIGKGIPGIPGTGKGIPWWVWVLLALLACICIGVIIKLANQTGKKEKKKRGMVVDLKDEAASYSSSEVGDVVSDARSVTTPQHMAVRSPANQFYQQPAPPAIAAPHSYAPLPSHQPVRMS